MVDKIKEAALETLTIEADAVEKLKGRIDDEFVAAVQCILDCKARVVVTGMGKSGHIGRKMAATFASTGTPAFFMHPGEAFHGDLGMVTENDVVIAISNSGESTEVVNILPIIRRIGATIIAMSGRRDSQLGKAADHFVDIGVEHHGYFGHGRCACHCAYACAGFHQSGICPVPSGRRFGQKAFAHRQKRYAYRRRKPHCA